MADDLSLLFRIRGDAAGAKQATAETRAAVASLRSQLGFDFSHIQNATNSVFSNLSNNVNAFVGERLPLLGGSFIRVTENLKGFGDASKKGVAELAGLNKTIDGLASSTGKSRSEITTFLTSFVQLETQAKRDTAAIETFGVTTAQTLIPQLEKAGEEMATVAASGEGLGASMAGLAGPIGIALVAVAALTAGVVVLVKEFIDLTVSTAEWQGKMQDLSQQVGISTETLSALEVLAKTTGGSIEGLTASLGIFQKKLEEGQDPESKTADLLKSLGIETNNTEEAFRQSIKALAGMDEGYHQTATALELFGRGGKSILAIIKETNGDLDSAIKRFRELGLVVSQEDAKAADEFNDQLAVLGFQVRATTAILVKDSIPQILSALRAVSEMVKENRDTIEAVSFAVTAFVRGSTYILLGTLKGIEIALNGVRDSWLAIQAASLIATGTSVESAVAIFEALRQAQNAVLAPTAVPVGTPSQKLSPLTVNREQVEGLKSLALEQARISEGAIAQAKADFAQGQRTRQQESVAIIAELRKQKDAQVEALNAEIQLKQKIADSQKDDLTKQREVSKQIETLRQNARDAESNFNQKRVAEEVQAQDDLNKNFIQHAESQFALRKKANDAEIQLIQARIKTGEELATQGAGKIEQIENSEFEARRQIIKQELALEGLGNDDRKRILQQRADLEVEATIVKREQAERRKQIAHDEFEFERDLILATSDSRLHEAQLRDSAEIASLRALADLRVKTEEETAREITTIQLAAIDRQAAAIKARQSTLGSIIDPKERKKVEQQLNNDLRSLKIEREATDAEGDRNSETGRQKDLANRKQYAASILSLDHQITASGLAQRRFDLEQLSIKFGLNSTIISAFRKLTLDEAAERHKRVVDEITSQEAQAHAVDVGNKNQLEIEQKYNKLREQENQRFKDQQGEINKPGGADISGRGRLSPVEEFLKSGGFASGLSQIIDLDKGIDHFGARAMTVFSAVTGAVQSLAQGIGDMVGQWVLLGGAAEGGMRKMVASVLSGVAAQAATLAVFELALAIAALTPFGAIIYGSPAQHFQAAALFGSIAAVAATAGRAVAGNSFQQQGTSGGGSGGGGSRSGGSSSGGSSAPLTLGSQRTPQFQLTIKHEFNTPLLKDHVTNIVVTDAGTGGAVRQAIVREIKRQE